MRGVAVVLSQLLLLLTAATAAETRWPQCQEKCGTISIPYPFGIGDGCYLGGFQVRCNKTKLGLRPIIGMNFIVDEFYRATGNVRVFGKINNWRCYLKRGKPLEKKYNWIRLDGPYRLSDTRNKFTAIGCDTVATIQDTNGNRNFSSCKSTCVNMNSVTDGSCSGMGCCQTSIPKGLSDCAVQIDTPLSHTNVLQFNPCSWAFIADEEWFSFKATDVKDANFFRRNKGLTRLVLDWRIGSQTCKEAMTENSACLSSHSDCIDSTNGPGYLCNCSAGYQGNPYLPDGCQDINECEEPEKHNCYGSCKNIEGNFTCSCPPGKHGSPYSPGGCQAKFRLVIKLVVGISCGVMVTVVIIVYLYVEHGKVKLSARAKKKFFKRNGGALLKDKIREERGVTFKIYDHEELLRATNKFDKNLELGQGGSGTVYEGHLDKVGKVAIKKAKKIDEDRKEEFINELHILSKINHEHVVKLLGCCLEVEVPMLVYEYVANGTLSEHIHHTNGRPYIPFDTRLKIALECAEALAYLHSGSSRPILHGDVTSCNILLDETYVAKVFGLGTSMLVPTNDVQFAELVQGTGGYLDPEFLQTQILTEKSDVYSFGVVLLELITGKPALYSEDSKEVKSLSSAFLSAIKNDRLEQILENRVKNECNIDLLQEFVELVKRCLNDSGEGRPSMKDVAEELRRIILDKPNKRKRFFYGEEVVENMIQSFI